MADDVTSERWAEKTGTLIGADLSQPAPVMRYQLLPGQDVIHTLQLFPDGSTARGRLGREEFEQFTGKPLGDAGWYDPWGEFLGDDPQIAGE
jgi:hypothetical protein